jgi:ATPase family AAA domain-containing protein 3A/B
MARLLLLASVFLVSSGSTKGSGMTDSVEDSELYLNSIRADTSVCLDTVLSLPLKVYEFKYDAVAGRRQMGVVGPEVLDILPDGVEVKAKSSFPNPVKGEPPVAVENVAVVDKNVIFMQNVGAVQELSSRLTDILQHQTWLKKASEDVTALTEEIQLALKQEVNQQELEKLRLLGAEADAAAMDAMLEISKGENNREAISITEARLREAQLAAHEAELKRTEVEAAAELKRASELLLRETEISQKREDMRRATDLAVMEARQQRSRDLEEDKLARNMQLLEAESEARAAVRIAQEEAAMQLLHAQAEEDRRRLLEGINSIFQHLSDAVIELSSRPAQLAWATAWFLGLCTAYFVLREALVLARRMLESRLGRPSLVRQTWRGKGSKSIGELTKEEFFGDVVLPAALREQVLSLATSTHNARRNGAPYRHLLLYGPPGTGKTMVATHLAAYSGMDCAIMSGGDVGPLGKNAVTELHKLFLWAKKSRRGLLLFIDEAEAFLGRRSSSSMCEDTRNALNALLHQTGSFSHHFMLVLATNRAEDLDSAVLDRMDDALLFPLPDVACREKLLRVYYRQHVASLVMTGRSPSFLSRLLLASLWQKPTAKVELGKGVLEDAVAKFALDLDGFSGREVSKLLLSIRNAAYGADTGTLTWSNVQRIVALKVQEHSRRMALFDREYS